MLNNNNSRCEKFEYFSAVPQPRSQMYGAVDMLLASEVVEI